MQVKSLKIHNILSIEDAFIEFSDTGLTLVDGWNYDDNRANGAGKTAIFNALAFGLYNKMPRKITASEIIRLGTKKASVEVEVVIGSSTWLISRERPTNLTIFKDAEQQHITQEELEKILGLSYNHFLLAVYTSQSSSDKFIFLNDTGKKDEILKLLDLEKLNKLKDLLTSQIKNAEKKIAAAKTDIATTVSNTEMVNKFLADNTGYEELLLAVKLEIAEVVSQLESHYEVAKPDFRKYNNIEQAIQAKRDILSDNKYKRLEFKNQYQALISQKKKLSDLPIVNCPSCNDDLHILGANLCKASDRKERVQQLEDHNQQIDTQLPAILNEIKTLETKELEITETIDKAVLKLSQIKQKESSDYFAAQSMITELQSKRSKLEAREQSYTTRIKQNTEYKSKITDLDLLLIQQQQSLSVLEADLLIKSTQLQIVSPAGVPAYIMDSIVDRINERVSEHMVTLWPNAAYRLMSYRENKSGDIKAKFSEVIVISGKERSLGSLSGGELSSVSLAVNLAFSEIVEQMIGRTITPLILDEAFDGMDAISRERAIELLNNISLKKQILIIDHASELRSMFSSTIKVEKQNDVSSVRVVI